MVKLSPHEMQVIDWLENMGRDCDPDSGEHVAAHLRSAVALIRAMAGEIERLDSVARLAWQPDTGTAEIERLRDTLSNLSNAAAIVFSQFEPKDGPGETAKALLKMELGLKD